MPHADWGYRAKAATSTIHQIGEFQRISEPYRYVQADQCPRGANNAGKTTAIGALRLVAAMLPQARRIAPTTVGLLDGRPVRGWPVTRAAFEAAAFAQENVRYDFRPSEAKIEVTATTGAKLAIVWEGQSDGDESNRPIFYAIPPNDSFEAPRTVAQEMVPTVSVVPTLSPLDDREAYVSDETLRLNLTSRRTSRYFRNALWRLTPEEWGDFLKFVCERTPEILNLELERATDSPEVDFDLFYTEPGTRHLRELAWAGDGIQIWMQALYHIWRQRSAPVLMLDEPDVFLHPDLQRRLARILFDLDQQVIIATHSVEILAEAEIGSAVWIDRDRRTAERPRSDGALAMIGRRLGSGYELGVARALRSNAVLFVEGDDLPILANIARLTNFAQLAAGQDYAVVSLGGFSRNSVAGAFTETLHALGSSVNTFVLLDGDLRSQQAVDAEKRPLTEAGAQVHVWQRREIENYLLQEEAIAKISGVSLPTAKALLQEVLESQKAEALVAVQSQRLAESKKNVGGTGKLAAKTVLESANGELEEAWKSLDGKLSVVDAKMTIRHLNQRLQGNKRRTLNDKSLARNLDPTKIPQELVSAMERIEEMIRLASRPH